MEEGRYQICVRISKKEVWDEFMQFVFEKEKKVKGVIGMYVENALMAYMWKHESVEKKDPNVRMQSLIQALTNLFDTCKKADRKVKIEYVYNMIRNHLNIIDRRSIKQRYEDLVFRGVIKEEYVAKTKEEWMLEQRKRALKTLNIETK